jgi:hypothetical protein
MPSTFTKITFFLSKQKNLSKKLLLKCIYCRATKLTLFTGGIYYMRERRLIVLGVRLTKAQVALIRQKAEAKHLTLSTLGRVLFEMFLRGEVQV